ncbi:hypothetical protein G6F57_023481 [Rhizopus arrhizus]|nr:hypothetical protein G6F57_023481 [Rhizopus arrhizus]
MVGIQLLEAVDGGQGLFVLAVLPVDVGQLKQRLLGVDAERVAAFDGGQTFACFLPASGGHFGLGVGVELFGAPVGGLVVLAGCRAAPGDDNDGQ